MCPCGRLHFIWSHPGSYFPKKQSGRRGYLNDREVCDDEVHAVLCGQGKRCIRLKCAVSM